MPTPKIIAEYQGFIVKTGGGRIDTLEIYYPDGVRSTVAPGSLSAAKRIIDRKIKTDKHFERA